MTRPRATMPLGQPAAASLGEALADITTPTSAPLSEVLADFTAVTPAPERDRAARPSSAPLAEVLADLGKAPAMPLSEALSDLTAAAPRLDPPAGAFTGPATHEPPYAIMTPPAAATIETGPADSRPPSTTSRLRRGSGTFLALLGVLLVGAAAWLELGTGWLAARSQDDLAADLAAEPQDLTVVDFAAVEDPAMDGPIPDAEDDAEDDTEDDTEDDVDGDRPSEPAAAPDPNSDHGAPDGAGLGDAVAQISIPDADVDHTVVVGVGEEHLAAGPGWVDASARPGTVGNTVISGHRTTYGAPFRHLDRLEPGAEIVISQPGRPDAVYEVRDRFLVDPDEVGITAPTDGARLTLTTCHPVGSDAERLIVQAELVDGEHAEHAVAGDDWQPYDGDRRQP